MATGSFAWRIHWWWLAALLSPILAQANDTVPWAPSTVFVQAGVGDESTRAYVAGATWDLPWRHQYRYALLSGYFEADFGRWTVEHQGVTSSSWATQLGLTPVLRLRHDADSPWFAELAVGGNYILPLFQSGSKRFSTKFNFGDHLAIGRQFGVARHQEVALRLEHFSNGGIDHPNPGENFLQLRYAVRL